MKHEKIIEEFIRRCKEKFGEDLISVALFGSYARGTANGKSDIDVLLVVKDLRGSVGERLDKTLDIIMDISGLYGKEIYEHILTPDEVKKHPSILLDLTQDATILFDKENFLWAELKKIGDRLRSLHAERIWLDDKRWYWKLNPNIKIGEVVRI